MILLLNTGILLGSSQGIMRYILFPFSSYSIKRGNHMDMNERMVNEVRSCLNAGLRIINQGINQDDFKLYENVYDYKVDCNKLRKMCDYTRMFASTNQELIKSD